MTLQEIKDQVAKENDWDDWDSIENSDLLQADVLFWHSSLLNIVAIRYAKAKLEEAAEILRYDDTGREGYTWDDTEYDSKAVEYGFNQAIEYSKKSIIRRPLD